MTQRDKRYWELRAKKDSELTVEESEFINKYDLEGEAQMELSRGN